MDLKCYESEIDSPACTNVKDFQHSANQISYADPVLLDDRVLKNLLNTEHRFRPLENYFQVMETDITPQMRKMAIEWLMDVCEEEESNDNVVLLAVNYIDRYMSVVNIHRNKLQLLSAAGLLIVSKLGETLPIINRKLVIYSADNFTLKELLKM